MYSVKQISSQQTYAVRQPVLRPGKHIDSCIFDGDDLPQTVHFGVYDSDNLVGIVSVFRVSHPDFANANQYQLRGMAVLPTHQKKGLGDLLLEAAENYIKQQGTDLIWFNAREVAVGFYSKAGYTISGELFEIPTVGPHYVMFKLV
ncbi:GNAT family N-acetyltransferase [Flavobacterium alkalisoli]|uniref:GNAT family N-acetyltransferase n=1 Tax=Flavobacterium alkalisoli TaxID=2602769 RepID=A0A5B9FND9_9FLAO|nr:GNAT family N-acetyltransferase [Flavobacterium alkalisoli]QEE48285.1 GNAT family N-acetyltransferase [Flavobacterium alkalisoli]